MALHYSYDDFPMFQGWPSNKMFFLENMAWENQRHQQEVQQEEQEEDQEEQEEDQEESYVVITEEMEERNLYKCVVCQDRLPMVFKQDEEEWVFHGCKEHKGVVCHFPLCYQVVLEGGLDN